MFWRLSICWLNRFVIHRISESSTDLWRRWWWDCYNCHLQPAAPDIESSVRFTQITQRFSQLKLFVRTASRLRCRDFYCYVFSQEVIGPLSKTPTTIRLYMVEHQTIDLWVAIFYGIWKTILNAFCYSVITCHSPTYCFCIGIKSWI